MDPSPTFATTSMTTNSTNNNIRVVRMILLRHGEREDETEDYDARHRSYQDRIDPFLTPFGHRQALNAWKNILRALPIHGSNGKPILVASSPLRRCVGTAVMVSAAAAAQVNANPVEVVLPSEQGTNTATDSSSTTSTTTTATIPLLIMNGLGDCAAQMQHMGGIGKVVKGGWLDCAASPSNDCGQDTTVPTRFQSCLALISKTAAQVAQEQADKQQHLHSNHHQEPATATTTSSTTTDGQQPISVPLQFWRESRYNYTTARSLQDVAALTQPNTLAGHAVTSTGATTHNDRQQPTPMIKNAPSVDERCDQALERAVLHTVHSGLDTCVLVTHREAIRFVETYWAQPSAQSQQQTQPKSHKQRRRASISATKMYCCVAVYHVSVDMNTNKVLGWHSQGVVPYQTLQSSHMG